MQSFSTATETDAAGLRTTAAAPMSLTAGIAGQRYVAEQDSYTADGSAYTGSTFFRAHGSVQRKTVLAPDGSALSTTTVRPGGTSVVDVQGSGQTLQSVPSGLVLNHGAADTTFVFDPGHGLGVVRQFLANGPGHDTVSLPGSDLGDSIADVLRNTVDTAGGAIVFDPTSGDIVRLAGVSKVQLAHDRGDVAFHV